MSLLAIAPATKTVALGSATVVVSGISLRRLTDLIATFPELAGFVIGGGIDVKTLLAQAPDGALAAFAMGYVGPERGAWWKRAVTSVAEDHEAQARRAFENAAAGQQIEILATILDLTMKGGERAAPFLKAMLAPKLEPMPEPRSEPDSERASADPPQPPEMSSESMPVTSSV